MNILIYVPDNRVTDSFVPQLWPFILRRLTPPGARPDTDRTPAPDERARRDDRRGSAPRPLC